VQGLLVEKRIMSVILKPSSVEWQLFGRVCSVLTSTEECFHTSGIPWPVRSPDPTVRNFFQRGCLKERVYSSRSHTTQELKRDIRYEIAT